LNKKISFLAKDSKMRRLFVSIAAVLILLPLIASAAGPAKSDGSESLGNKLLDDLTPKTGEKSDAAWPPSAQFQQPAAGSPAKLAAPASSPLARVQQGMQNASMLLAQPAVNSQSGNLKLAGSAQQVVVSHLDKLIADLSKQCQCQGGQCNKPPDPTQSGKPKPGGKPAMAAGRGNAPARESSDRLDRDSAKQSEKGDVNDVVKDLWGHLPERSREQLLQSFSEEFLPKYEREIQQYYRRLSDDQNNEEK
jgi:hypothetical protein